MSASFWRIATEAPDYSADDKTGLGAKLSGGRWNRIGTPMLYASTNISLACLETIVHLNAAALPLNRYLIRIEATDSVVTSAIRVDSSSAPSGWDAQPAGKASLDFGTDWSDNLLSALLFVPSIIVPEECNVLINPLHADAVKITVTNMRRWHYDSRVGS